MTMLIQSLFLYIYNGFQLDTTSIRSSLSVKKPNHFVDPKGMAIKIALTILFYFCHNHTCGCCRVLYGLFVSLESKMDTRIRALFVFVGFETNITMIVRNPLLAWFSLLKTLAADWNSIKTTITASATGSGRGAVRSYFI